MLSGVTIDLVWVNQQADDILIACVVNSDHDLNHHSDHHALVTFVSINCDNGGSSGKDHSSDKACYRVNQAQFITELKALLHQPYTPLTPADIIRLDLHISNSISTALNLASPEKSTTHKHKAWRNPTIMGPLRKEAARARKKAKTHPSDENRATYFSSRNRYFHAIETEKTMSWQKIPLHSYG